MQESVFDQRIDRQNTGSLKWDRYAGRDVLPLWVADMDFAAPPAILNALEGRVQHGVFGYTRPPTELNGVVCDYLKNAHQAHVDPDWIIWLPGCVPALSMACASVGQVGDRVLTCTPVYPPFLHVHKDSGKNLDCVPLVPDSKGSYRFDWDALEQSVAPTTRVFLFCNPHNPTGRAFSQTEVEQVAAFCHRHNLVLCSDEIHCDLLLETSMRHVSVLTLSESMRDRCITLMAASKTYNIAGLACAFAVVPDVNLRRLFAQSAGKLLPEISPLSFVATQTAYCDCEPWRQELIAYLRRNRDVIAEFIAQNREFDDVVTMTPLEATYLAWLDVRRLGLDNPYAYFEQHGLGFSDGGSFGAPGFMRMNFGCPLAQVNEALQRLQSAVALLRVEDD